MTNSNFPAAFVLETSTNDETSIIKTGLFLMKRPALVIYATIEDDSSSKRLPIAVKSQLLYSDMKGTLKNSSSDKAIHMAPRPTNSCNIMISLLSVSETKPLTSLKMKYRGEL